MIRGTAYKLEVKRGLFNRTSFLWLSWLAVWWLSAVIAIAIPFWVELTTPLCKLRAPSYWQSFELIETETGFSPRNSGYGHDRLLDDFVTCEQRLSDRGFPFSSHYVRENVMTVVVRGARVEGEHERRRIIDELSMLANDLPIMEGHQLRQFLPRGEGVELASREFAATTVNCVFWIAAALVVVSTPMSISQSRNRLRFKLGRRRVAKGRCPACRYDIRGLPQPRCPECGASWPESDTSTQNDGFN